MENHFSGTAQQSLPSTVIPQTKWYQRAILAGCIYHLLVLQKMINSPDPRLGIRPQITTAPAKQPNEAFLHQTLRPVLKLQNELLVSISWHFLEKRKVKWAQLNEQQRLQQIQDSIGKDNKLRGLLLGCILGQFTASELTYYLENEAEINRRISALLIQRLQDQL